MAEGVETLGPTSDEFAHPAGFVGVAGISPSPRPSGVGAWIW